MTKLKKFLKKLAPDWALNLYHAIWPVLGIILYRNPSKKIKVIGVTGTNGKTTVVHIATHILQEAGLRVASLSSLRFQIDKKEWKNKLKITMPGRMKLQKFLRQAVNAKCRYVVMEVTSEGIKQNRHKYIDFNTLVFTNLSREHIESHGGYDNYRDTKGKLFAARHEVSIVNADDKLMEYFMKFNAEQKIVYSLDEDYENVNYKTVIASGLEQDSSGTSLEVDGVWLDASLLGEFNAYNMLAAICIGLSANLKLVDIAKYLKTFSGVGGRLERVIGEPFNVYVDYAHTPDALEKVLETIKTYTSGRLISVFGAAGGGRDKWKRPEFARIASSAADYIILTNEDPYDEDPEKILDEIESGFSEAPSSKFQVLRVLDRRNAINRALQEARPGDTVLITGKGAEPLMVTKNGSIDWDDRDVVREEFAKIYL